MLRDKTQRSHSDSLAKRAKSNVEFLGKESCQGSLCTLIFMRFEIDFMSQSQSLNKRTSLDWRLWKCDLQMFQPSPHICEAVVLLASEKTHAFAPAHMDHTHRACSVEVILHSLKNLDVEVPVSHGQVMSEVFGVGQVDRRQVERPSL